MAAGAFFWGSLLILVYAYLGYPLLLEVWAPVRVRPWRRAPTLPTVTVVVAAWDEAPTLPRRITNLLAQEYPAARLDVIIVSDGSTDRTDEVMRQFNAGRVTYLELDRRQGEGHCLEPRDGGGKGRHHSIRGCPPVLRPGCGRAGGGKLCGPTGG